MLVVVLQVDEVHNTSKSPASILSALVKGFLTRKLFMSNKVQFTVTTIKVCTYIYAGSHSMKQVSKTLVKTLVFT